jgi:hypothetical protein
MVTVAPVTTAPVESITLPKRAAVVRCATMLPGRQHSASSTVSEIIAFQQMIVFPFPMDVVCMIGLPAYCAYVTLLESDFCFSDVTASSLLTV